MRNPTRPWLCRCAPVAAAMVLLWWAPPRGTAQTPSDASRPTTAKDPKDELIQQLLQRVQALEGKLDKLEAKKVSPVTPETPLSQPPPDLALDDLKAKTIFPQLTFKGFADVKYSYSDAKGSKNSFSVGQFDLFPTARIAENFSAFGEIVFSAGQDNKWSVTPERFIFQYTPNDWFNLNVGRFHTGLGYYNSAYHHGAWLQTAVTRPLIYGGLFPIHSIGLSVNGQIPSGRLGLSYLVELSNGRHYGPGSEESNQSITDDNDAKAVNVGLRMSPTWAPGLELGATVFHDRLSPVALSRTDQTIFVGHVVYKLTPWEILAEGMLFRHDIAGVVTWVPGAYGQVGYHIGKFEPYVRYDYQDATSRDQLFKKYGFVGLKHGPTLGVRWNFTDYAALKVQYSYLSSEGQSVVRSFNMQVAYTF